MQNLDNPIPMTQLQLFAVTARGPQPLPTPDDAVDFTTLYDDVDLGVYTTLRTFDHNKFLHLDRHLARTVASMRGLGWQYELDEIVLRRALHRVCTAYPAPEMRVRIDVLPAPARPLGSESRVLLAVMPFTPPPPELYERGVTLNVAPGLARAQPAIKTADFLAARRALKAAPNVYEYLMVDGAGRILEGASSNFYGVRAGTIFTAGEGVLAGITRKILLELAETLAIPVRLKPVTVDEIATLDEAAISSSSRGLLPAVQIAGQVIGAGRPGPISRQLLNAYNAYVREAIQPAIEND